MITPVEIQSISFKSGIGYVKKDVEAFMNIVSNDYETIYKENKELKEKLKTLSNTLSHYKTIEMNMQNTLDLANKAAKQIKESAKQSARQIEEEAVDKAKLILKDYNEEIERLQKKIQVLAEQYESFLSRFKEVAKEQLEKLESDDYKLEMPEL